MDGLKADLGLVFKLYHRFPSAGRSQAAMFFDWPERATTSDGQQGRCIGGVPCGLAGSRERPVLFRGQHSQKTRHLGLPCLTRVAPPVALPQHERLRPADKKLIGL